MNEVTKPRISYAAFQASRRAGMVASIIERFIREMDGHGGKPPVRPIGRSQGYTLRMLQRAPVGAKRAAELRKADVIEHCRGRRAAGIKPQTVNQDVTYLSGVLKYAGSAWEDCEDVSDAAVAAAKPFLAKHGLISKSVPRDRRPTEDELRRLCDHFEHQNAHPLTEIDMVRVTRWQVASGRRISESCRLLWEDWNRDAHTILVRQMKDPRNRNKSKVVALPDEAQALLEQWWETRDQREPRILPYNAKSAGQRYTAAKKRLGIVNLRLHDNRRHCGSTLVERGYSPAQAILVTGHETTQVFERVYMKVRPETFKNGPAARAVL